MGDQEPARHRWTLLWFLGLALLTFGLDITLLNSSLPDAATTLGASVDELQWFAGAYTLSVAATLPLAGIVGDQGRPRSALLLALGTFAVANAAVVLVTAPWHLIVLRALQGAASAFILALAIAIVARVFSGEDRLKALSVAALASTVGIPIGPFAGGIITTALDFQWVFMVNVPFALSAFAGVLLLARKDQPTRARRIGLFPYVMGVGLLSLTWGLVQSGHDPGVLPLSSIAAGGLVVAFAVASAWRGRTLALPRPVLELASFRHGSAGIFITAVVMVSAIFVVPQHLGFLWGWTPIEIAWGLTPVIVSLIVGTRLAVPFHRRWGLKTTAAAGFAVTTVGCALYGAMGPTASWPAIMAWSLPLGLGLGVVLPLAMDLTLKEVETRHFGAASAAAQAARQIGGTIGVAALGSVVNAVGATTPGAEPFQWAFVVLAAVSAAATLMSLRLPKDYGTASEKGS